MALRNELQFEHDQRELPGQHRRGTTILPESKIEAFHKITNLKASSLLATVEAGTWTAAKLADSGANDGEVKLIRNVKEDYGEKFSATEVEADQAAKS